MKKNIWLFILIGIAFVIRIWGIRFCLPFRYAHIDESVVIFYTMRFFGGIFNPFPFFDYPTLHLYLLFIINFFYMIIGGFSPESFMDLFMSNPTSIYLLGRLFSVLLGVGTVYLTYLIARRMFDRSTGLLAGLFICLNLGHALHSHYATVDISSLFFIMLAALFICGIFTQNGMKNYILAGLFIGLATATKYYGFIFFLNVIVAHWFYNRKKYLKVTDNWHFPVVSFCFILIGFLSGFPWPVLDFTRFIARFADRFQLIIGAGLSQGKSILSYGWFSYPRIMLGSMGWLPFIVGLASIIWIIVKKQKRDILVLSFIIVFYLFSGSWKVVTGRYALPLYPFFAIISARFVFWISGKLKGEVRSNYFVYGMVIILLAAGLPEIIRTDYILSRKDTRLIAYEWFVENIPEESSVLREPFTPEFRKGENYRVKVDWDEDIRDNPIEVLSREYDYVLVSNFNYSSEYDFETRLNEKAVLVKEFAGERAGMFHNPRIRIYKLPGS